VKVVCSVHMALYLSGRHHRNLKARRQTPPLCCVCAWIHGEVDGGQESTDVEDAHALGRPRRDEAGQERVRERERKRERERVRGRESEREYVCVCIWCKIGASTKGVNGREVCEGMVYLMSVMVVVRITDITLRPIATMWRRGCEGG